MTPWPDAKWKMESDRKASRGRIICIISLSLCLCLCLSSPRRINRCSSKFWRITRHMMDYTLAILLSLLQLLSMCTAAPLPVEVKSKVKRLAEQLVVRLDKDFQFPAGRTLSPATAEDLDGLPSILMVLNGYNSLISDSLSGVHQIKSDISSLTGFLDQWRQDHCSGQQPKPSVPEALQRLQSQKEFIHTVSFEALMRVKEFLKLLLKKLEHLESC